MLENVTLDQSISKEEYQLELPGLQRRLYELEKACWDLGVSSVVLFEGWEAAGKGGAIATLTQRLDPRGFKLHSMQPPVESEQRRPWLYRFWMRVPNRGEMVIFDRSWYMRVLDQRVAQVLSERVWRQAFREIVEFERMLADDGTVIVKFFLHISQKEQKRRFRKVKENPLEAWRITKQSHRQNKHYDRYREAVEELLELTESEYAPWTLVDATCKRYSRKKVFETIIAALEQKLGDRAPAKPVPEEDALRDLELRAGIASLAQDLKER